jgi:hypothetical protein
MADGPFRYPTIRTPEVEQAARALVKSIEQAAANSELECDLAEGCFPL